MANMQYACTKLLALASCAGLEAGTPAVVGVVEDFGTWASILVQVPGSGRYAVVRAAGSDGTCSVQPGNYAPDSGFSADGEFASTRGWKGLV